ncbi:MAG TPA: response regulator [Candidatus Limnocylindrales bacterium]|nr:response regulator [Candidatus Limnocylindrales bacterium]
MDEPDPPTAVEAALRAAYPDARLIKRDPLAGFDAEGGWYALRGGVRTRDAVRRILVVDDDPATADVISAALEGRPFEVRCAPDGQAALALIAEWPPSLVLLDLTMPRMSGDEFGDRYRELPAPRAPLVVVSVARDAPMRALRIEARSVVPKPFDLEQLVHLVDRYA